MENLENNIIENKINSLGTLPEGYTPNLDSKWSMLEAGLQGNSRSPFIWKPFAAAAILLLLGGSILLMQQIKQKSLLKADYIKLDEQVKRVPSTITHAILPAKQHSVALKQHANPPKAQQDKRIISEPTPAVVGQEPAALVQSQEASQPIATAAAPKKKQPHFVEIDFNNPPISSKQYDEPFLAFRAFKFNPAQQNSTTGSSSDNRSQSIFNFQKSF